MFRNSQRKVVSVLNEISYLEDVYIT